MVTRRDLLELVNSIASLPISSDPIKKSGLNTVSKVQSESGTVIFSSTKNVTVVFSQPFTKTPLVQLTMGDAGNSPVYRSVTTKTQMTMRFKTNRTGDVDRIATERS